MNREAWWATVHRVTNSWTRRYTDSKSASKKMLHTGFHQEIQIKTIIRYCDTPIRMAKSRTLTTPNADKDVVQWELSLAAGGNAKWHSYIGRQFGSFL